MTVLAETFLKKPQVSCSFYESGLCRDDAHRRQTLLLVDREDVARRRRPDLGPERRLLERHAEDVERAVGVRIGLRRVVELLRRRPLLADELEVERAGLREVHHLAELERHGHVVERQGLALHHDLATGQAEGRIVGDARRAGTFAAVFKRHVRIHDFQTAVRLDIQDRPVGGLSA